MFYQNQKRISDFRGQSVYNLRSLSLTDSELEQLYLHPTQNIKQLKLDLNNITFVGLIVFPTVEWKNLVLLELYGNRIGDKGCKYLSKALLINLQLLGLANNRIGTSGLSHIAKSSLIGIQSIDLNTNKLGVDSCYWITRGCWSLDGNLILFNNKISSHQFARLTTYHFNAIKMIAVWHNCVESCEKQRLVNIIMKKINSDKLLI